MGYADSFVFGGGFRILFMLMFGLIAGMFVVLLVRNIGTWNKNNHSPRLTVSATVTAKRTQVNHHGSMNSAGGSSTRYYVTFQVDSGDRMELPVSGPEYGMLAEGDQGSLTFQGTRYLGFERT